MSRVKIAAALCIAALAGLAVIAQRWRGNDKILTVRVRGEQMVSEKEILDSARIALGGKLSDVDLRGVRWRVGRNPYIRSVTVQRGDQAVDIDVAERAPVGRIAANGAMALFDGDGDIFPAASQIPLDVPVVYGVTKRINGAETIDTQSVRIVAAMLREIASSSPAVMDDVSAIRRQPAGDFILETIGNAVPVRFGDATGAREKARLLNDFMPLLEKRGESDAQYIDVRFHDQVVVRWKDSPGAQ